MHLLSLCVRVVQHTHRKVRPSPGQELLLSPSAGTLKHTQSYSHRLHQQPLTAGAASPSPSQPRRTCPLWQLTGRVGVTDGGSCTLPPTTLKIHVIAQKFSFIHISWISHHYGEWIWLQSGGSEFGLLRALIDESWAKHTEMRNWSFNLRNYFSCPSSDDLFLLGSLATYQMVWGLRVSPRYRG